MSGRSSGRTRSGGAARALTGAAAALVVGAASVAPGDPVTPPPGASSPPESTASAADTTDALDGYLDDLSRRSSDDFLLQQLSISDAEVDSLIRVYESTGRPPVETAEGTAPPRGWSLDTGLAGVRYNRVEGANVLGRAAVSGPGPGTAFVTGGWGWAAGEPTWRGGLRVDGPYGASLEVAHSREVWSYGAGGVPGNSVLALMAGRDENDYFRGEGWSASVDLDRGAWRAGAAWSAEDQESVANETDFTLFDEGHAFRLNPPIRDGHARRVAVSVGAGDRAAGRASIDLLGAVAGRGLGGDFDYESVGVSVLARRPLWFGDELKIRLTGASVTGDPPYQALHFLGGPQRLRGYEVNELSTRKAAHAALDYKMGTNPLGWVPFLRRVRIQPVPFFDAAAIFETQSITGETSRPDRPDWRFDTGLGLQYNVLGIPGGSGQLRVDVARRLDRGDDNTLVRLGFTIER